MTLLLILTEAFPNNEIPISHSAINLVKLDAEFS